MSVATKAKAGKKSIAAPEENAPAATAFERAIILRATSMVPGSIATNWEQVLAAVEAKSKEYQDITKYAGDDKQAKEDRALLRKQKSMTKTTIASIQEAWNEPLKPFITGGKQIEKQFDLAIDAIDEWVKEGEAKDKGEKKNAIQAYFDGKNFDLVPLDMFFDERWLNKGCKIQDVKKEIDAKIAEIYANIKILETVADHGAIAKALYLDTLDMGAAMLKVQTLKENAAKLAREQAEREDRERRGQVEQNAAEERREERQAAREERTQSLAAAAMDFEEPAVPSAPPRPVIIEYTMRFSGTEQQLLKLREYMTANGIAYEKLNARYV